MCVCYFILAIGPFFGCTGFACSFCFLFVGLYLLNVVYCLLVVVWRVLLLVVRFPPPFLFCVCGFVLVAERSLCDVCGSLAIVVSLLFVGVYIYICAWCAIVVYWLL